MKSKRNIFPTLIAVIILAAGITVGRTVYGLVFGGAVQVQSSDLNAAIAQMVPQFVVGGILLALGIALLIISAASKQRGRKIFLSTQGGVAIVLAVLATVTLICTGPQASNLNTAFSGTNSISAEHIEASAAAAESIADEGITLLKNENAALPLASGTKLNVFGWSSVNPVYGGAGSGSSDSSHAASLLDGLHEAGFETNKDLEDFYTAYRADRPGISFFGVDFTIPEPDAAAYESAGIIDSAKDFSDTALIVIGRSSGEGSDLAMSMSEENNFVIGENGQPVTFSTQADDMDPEKSYLELSDREIAMVEAVTANFDNVYVIINSSQPMELGWLDEHDAIKGALLCPSPGQVGFRSLGKILNGTVNPSGHLVDTFVYDLHTTPYINNFGSFFYTDYEDVTGAAENRVPFVKYNEGIYVGYKFYETAAAEGLINYDEVVQYPFGYGLSYTQFDAKIGSVSDDGQTFTVPVEVTNTGDTAGKFVAQIYFTPPYTNGGIEKASMNLVEFAKTSLLDPGASETVTVTFAYEDMASYDSQKIKAADGAYVLEAGEYDIHLCADSHTVLDTYTAKVEKDRIYDDEHDGARSTDISEAVNKLEYADGGLEYLSRKDHFANYEAVLAGPTDFTMTDAIKAEYSSRITFDASEFDAADAAMPVTGAQNGLKIQDMVGVPYDDAKWDSLLDQLTVSELKSISGDGTFHVVETSGINLPYIFETDGPTAVNSFFTGKTGTAFPAPIMVASTWNKELAELFGESIGNELSDYGFTGWYGPAMNIHRTAFSGRNFEYYSEDGVLSGEIAAREVAAARKLGIIPYLKHFVLNDSETDRAKGICTWCTEQAIREIYMKPFELAVKEGGANGIMNSKNGIGSKWVGASPALMNGILRGEWNFQGVVLTDSLDTVSEYYQDPNAAIRAGTDKMLPMGFGDGYWADESAGTITALRTCAHNILYALANSNAMDVNVGMPSWQKALFGFDALIALLLILWEIFTVLDMKKEKR